MSGVIDRAPDVRALVGEENILIGHRICPFVQRVVIVFDELSIPYKKSRYRSRPQARLVKKVFAFT